LITVQKIQPPISTVCTVLMYRVQTFQKDLKRDSIYLHWQKLVDLTFTWSYWNKLSCQKPVFLGQGWCNSSISFCLDANWMSFELTLNRMIVPQRVCQSVRGTETFLEYIGGTILLSVNSKDIQLASRQKLIEELKLSYMYMYI
jgi:hypothetical protein